MIAVVFAAMLAAAPDVPTTSTSSVASAASTETWRRAFAKEVKATAYWEGVANARQLKLAKLERDVKSLEERVDELVRAALIPTSTPEPIVCPGRSPLELLGIGAAACAICGGAGVGAGVLLDR